MPSNEQRQEGHERRKAILDFIIEYKENEGLSPSIREIGEAVGLKSTSNVFRQLEIMETEGTIKRDKRYRSIMVIKKTE